MKLAHVIGKTKTTQIDFGDGDLLNLTYRPAAITGEMVASANSMSERTDIDQFYKNLVEVLVSWDLENEEGTVPLTAEAFSRVGFAIMLVIFQQMCAKMGEAVAAK